MRLKRRMEMDDAYCYPDSFILKNKLGIHDSVRLEMAEIKLASVRLYQLMEQPVHGNFDFNHLCGIHKHIFQDLYDWAGHPRTVDIAKGNSLFCLTQHMSGYAQTIFPQYHADCIRAKGNPEKYVHVFTEHYADLNALHPFREGNGRSQREFARELCLKCGYDFDLRQTNHEEMIAASIKSLDKGDNSMLEVIFTKCIKSLHDSF